jgi:hypothetical protein
LAQVGDLPRLATSPLLHLPQVTAYLAEVGGNDDVIERAVQLRRLLTEHIARLKPPGGAAMGTGHDWRHYNALYYPYVVGLKPYNTRLDLETLTPEQQTVLAWFQAQVPERTLYNWQSAAAKLVAHNLRAAAPIAHRHESA